MKYFAIAILFAALLLSFSRDDIGAAGNVPDNVITDVSDVYWGRGTFVVLATERTPGNGDDARRQKSLILRLTPKAAKALAAGVNDQWQAIGESNRGPEP